MTKMKIIVPFVLAVSLCSIAASQNIKPYQFSIKTERELDAQAKAMADDNRFLCLTFNKELWVDGEYSWDRSHDVFIDYGRNNLVMIHDHEFDNYYLVTNDSTVFVDKERRELTVFRKKAKSRDFYIVGAENYINTIPDGLDYYLRPLKGHCRKKHPHLPIESRDTTIRGTDYTKYMAHSGVQHFYNEKTRRFDIPIDDVSVSFVNNETNCLDSVYITNITDNDNKTEAFIRVMDISNDNKYQLIDSVFDFTSVLYAGYTVHDNLNPPTSIVGTTNRNLTDEVLDFPIVSLDGDTTTIRNEQGWLFLDFWFIGCGACEKSFQTIKEEQDSLGYRILEREGIKMMLVNEFSDNVELVRERIDQYSIDDIVYTAKGVSRIYRANPCPYIILISPDKQKVYEVAGNNDCYKQLLKAKREYERNNKY